jgi:hypothetical protein
MVRVAHAFRAIRIFCCPKLIQFHHSAPSVRIGLDHAQQHAAVYRKLSPTSRNAVIVDQADTARGPTKLNFSKFPDSADAAHATVEWDAFGHLQRRFGRPMDGGR